MRKLLEVERLRAGYGLFSVLRDVSFHVEERAIVALVGSNGAGKTTCLRCIAGLLEPTGGTIRFRDHPVAKNHPHELVQAGLVSVPEGRQLFPAMTVRDTLLVGGSTPRARAKRAESLERVFALFPKLEQRQNQLCGTLSGGEQQMVAIGRGLMALPTLLVLDEPSLGLAPTIVKQLFQTVQAIRDQGVTVLLVEQNVRTVLKIADSAYVIENGTVELSGRAQELASDPRVVDAYFGVGAKELL
jgi:branched-chain amino acid transport system ATP-binding protein